MRKDYQNPTGQPPVWAEALLRALLPQRSRDAIAGDLLEEYRESVLPAGGTFLAKIWYVRQVLSFLDLAVLVEVARKIPPLLWGTCASLAVYILLFAVPYATGTTVSTVLLFFTGIVLTIVGATAIRNLIEGWSLLRPGLVPFICFGLTTAVAVSAKVFRPTLIVGTFVVIVTVTGFQWTFRTGQFRSGIVAAVGIGTAAAALILVAVSLLHLPHPPIRSVVVLPAAAAILGAIGAVFGKRFGCSKADVLILTTIFI
jgi:hypothetical protein